MFPETEPDEIKEVTLDNGRTVLLHIYYREIPNRPDGVIGEAIVSCLKLVSAAFTFLSTPFRYVLEYTERKRGKRVQKYEMYFILGTVLLLCFLDSMQHLHILDLPPLIDSSQYEVVFMDVMKLIAAP